MLVPTDFVRAGYSGEKSRDPHFGVSMKYGAFELLYLRQVQKRPFRL